ncbi:hypothetical protein MSG28_001299 [Choristoneura fumiferana]|uniref:Uncharacterized protein n=1 Tax=Choristoneura fumiferana TaxID=7141 RepID=A0ACC0K4Y4_CHOFU|nr:hypothetical protein MSG28_001299 [Choristoneura fumiferana]
MEWMIPVNDMLKDDITKLNYTLIPPGCHGDVRSVEPLCVLDFFVSGARQRRGNGKRLFDFMLQDTGSQPRDLAIDGPSSKMETFLAKNYGVDRLMRQSNNFAVIHGQTDRVYVETNNGYVYKSMT